MNWKDVKILTIGDKSAVRVTVGDEVVWTGLPVGFQQLDYIESAGEQYIDTGFIPDQDSRILCEIYWLGGMNVFGARSTVASRNFSARVISGYWQLGYGSNGGVTTGTVEAQQTWQTVEIRKNELYVDGVFSVSREYMVFTAPYPIALGAIRAGSLYYGTARYRGCRIWDGETLVRDLIPCRSPGGIVGMYDTVNAVFYGNSGTGEFAAGADV